MTFHRDGRGCKITLGDIGRLSGYNYQQCKPSFRNKEKIQRHNQSV